MQSSITRLFMILNRSNQNNSINELSDIVLGFIIYKLLIRDIIELGIKYVEIYTLMLFAYEDFFRDLQRRRVDT